MKSIEPSKELKYVPETFICKESGNEIKNLGKKCLGCSLHAGSWVMYFKFKLWSVMMTFS